VSQQPENLAPEVGFEPTTNRLTADRSTTELLWIVFVGRLTGRIFAHAGLSSKSFFLNRDSAVIDRRYRRRGKLVAGAEFEPAVPQSRDYEPGSPVIL
jgi:hypothetical protein